MSAEKGVVLNLLLATPFHVIFVICALDARWGSVFVMKRVMECRIGPVVQEREPGWNSNCDDGTHDSRSPGIHGAVGRGLDFCYFRPREMYTIESDKEKRRRRRENERTRRRAREDMLYVYEPEERRTFPLGDNSLKWVSS